jgi:hypothetical protein
VRGTVVDIGGVSILLTSSDAERADPVAHLLGHVPHSTASPHVEVRCSARAPAMPRRAPDRTNADFRVWTTEDTLHLELTSGGRARVSATTAWIGTGRDDPQRAAQCLLLPVLTHLLSFRDRYVLHAGSVVAGGVAYLILGGTGTGKSTLGVAAVEHGWLLLGDDMVVVRRQDQRCSAAGIPRTVAVPSDVGSRLARGPLTDDHRGRWEVPAAVLERGWFPVGGLISVGHGTTNRAGLRRVDGRAALSAVLRSYTSSLDPLHLRRFFPVAAALSRLPAWELRHGVEPRSRLSEVGRMLRGIAPEPGLAATVNAAVAEPS